MTRWNGPNKRMRVIVVAGGEISPVELTLIQPDDWIISADAGVRSLLENGLSPHLAVGDFDTTGEEYLKDLDQQGIRYIRLPAEKNVTDTHFALEEAIRLQPKEIVILGALGGGRFDHALANLYLLEWLHEEGVLATIIHRNNRIQLFEGPIQWTLDKTNHTYVSLLPCSEKVTGITTSGLRYPLQNGTLIRGMSLGVSNELIGESATISVHSGKCFCIQSADF